MKAEQFNQILEKIEQGSSLRKACKEIGYKEGTTAFYDFLKKGSEEEREKKAAQYAHAREERQDLIFDEILSISDHSEEDHTPFTGSNVIQRDRLRIDARKWMLGKMNPKKYGDKVDLGMGDLPADSKVSISLNLGSDGKEDRT